MFKNLTAVAAAMFALAGAQASASLVLIDQINTTGPTTTIINTLLDDNGLGGLIFFTRQDSGGGLDESGAADSAFSGFNSSGTSGDFDFDLSGLDYELTHIVIKAGNDFFLLAFTADMIMSSGDDVAWSIPDGSALSNINFFGGEIPEIPIPGAIWLMGAGLAGLGAARRKAKAASAA